MRPEDLQATFCATLVDEWVRAGIIDAVVCPGSRSTPLALALAAEPRLRLHVILDERSAAFFALGVGMVTDRPSILLTTSGTAAVECHAAVVEAALAGVALLVISADRPPELRDIGAPQTVDQHRLFGGVTRWFLDPGPPDESSRSAWRSIAARAVLEATARPGPVHLNLPFREPLVGTAMDGPAGRGAGAPWHQAPTEVPPRPRLPELARKRGIVVAGRGAPAEATLQFALAMGWPLLADPVSGARVPCEGTISTADAILRVAELASALRPEVVVRIGAPLASKVLHGWLADGCATGTFDVLVDPHRLWRDPSRTADVVVRALPELVAPAPGSWCSRWVALDRVASTAIDGVIAEQRMAGLTEPVIARSVLAALPDGAALVVSSSMPIRDVEWFGAPRRGVRVFANRGVNGIDGVVSTALGVAARHPGPTVALIGDLAFLHDASGLVTAATSGVGLTLVVVDNGGGGIFEFLPQSSALPRDRFEALFGTPQDVDVASVARGFGLPTVQVATCDELIAALGRGRGVVVARTDRRSNVGAHEQINAAVRDALLSV